MQPTTHLAAGHRLESADTLELRTQAAAMHAVLHLITRALDAGLAAPHWEIHEAGHITAHFHGPRALIGLDAWRRILPHPGGVRSERRLSEIRWTAPATVLDVPVLLVAITPASTRTAVSV
ncbi:hypothetical protein [Streptomyces sp. CB03911]|uniref:hypothetical protein n=1 Tax=Streptomyces sp. CB03911 TaxID=1804758 RepID=UPI00093F3606|nr:hypothetical protein [Streptomyces sp. CB03911]OKI22234.1 hypothetical protein A6A07_34740 [Streptomyces sp. CB03911]